MSEEEILKALIANEVNSAPPLDIAEQDNYALNVNPARRAIQMLVEETPKITKRTKDTLAKILGSEEKVSEAIAPKAGKITQDNTEGAFSALWDRQVRKNISDRNVRLSPKIGMIKTANGGVSVGNTMHRSTIGDVVDHPELFEYYPELKKVPVTIKVDMYTPRKTKGSIHPDRGITVNATDRQDAMSTLLHEIQHWIQDYEGTWAKGSSPSSVGIRDQFDVVNKWRKRAGVDPKTGETIVKTPIGDLKPYELANKSDYFTYWLHAGEAEARDAQEKWLDIINTPRNVKPWWDPQPLSSQPVDLEDLLVR